MRGSKGSLKTCRSFQKNTLKSCFQTNLNNDIACRSESRQFYDDRFGINSSRISSQLKDYKPNMKAVLTHMKRDDNENTERSITEIKNFKAPWK